MFSRPIVVYQCPFLPRRHGPFRGRAIVVNLPYIVGHDIGFTATAENRRRKSKSGRLDSSQRPVAAATALIGKASELITTFTGLQLLLTLACLSTRGECLRIDQLPMYSMACRLRVASVVAAEPFANVFTDPV
jgi:hypothetical protein